MKISRSVWPYVLTIELNGPFTAILGFGEIVRNQMYLQQLAQNVIQNKLTVTVLETF